ncbi:MAG: hypothetical protein ACLQQ4_04125 [Bacteroidia bacterium]
MKGRFSINAGVGYSTIFFAANIYTNFETASLETNSMSPVYSTTIDCNFTKKSSVGIGVAYQQLNATPLSDNGDPIYWKIVNMSRANIGLRYLYLLSWKPYREIYTGIRAGISYWTFNESKSPTYTTPTPGFVLPISASETKYSVQLLFGYRRYFTDLIGIHIEFGIGTPYLVEGGLTFRLKKEKKD